MNKSQKDEFRNDISKVLDDFEGSKYDYKNEAINRMYDLLGDILYFWDELVG